MATWSHFVQLLTTSLGAANVEGGTGEADTTMVATLEATVKGEDGTEEKRRQKLHFEYDGKDVNWIAVTSFVAPASDNAEDLREFLEYLGEDWEETGLVIVDGQFALRHHISLHDAHDGKDWNAGSERVILEAYRAAANVAGAADFLERHLTKEDAM
ncbi:hypothetical protein [Streptomyces hainanensis]|uniref:Uncharacterized protein n=1 Tax=Streptomyces hainanensis TaxID=402648 RepID=A0A4R4TFJ2_9ACTN|nr:hypothetical protein [Streptomyces hainanensis]TDC76418.1 hypothetical protein E1283_09790 [Streptomyces hainanensis]